MPIGSELKRWRAHRRMSQMDLALEAGISTRHLSFVETGRSRPSRELVLKLADALAAPPRERNTLLTAAGFAPLHPQHALDDRDMAAARSAITHLLTAFRPFPALAVDRHWTIVDANEPLMALVGSVDPALLAPPINALRLSLHPGGLANRIVNLEEWRPAIFQRLREQIDASADPVLAALLDELRALPGGEALGPVTTVHPLAIPLIIESPMGRLSLLTMTSVFGSPVDVTLSELAIETFLPADDATLAALQKL